MTYRPIQPEDYGIIVVALEDYLSRLLAKGRKRWLKNIDLNKVMDVLFDDDSYVFIVDESYLVFYEVGSPWYNDDVTFEEKIVLTIKPGGDFAAVPAFLEERASLHGASIIGVGTALAPSDAALARVYSKYGYTQEALTLMKEVNVDVR